MSQFVSASNLTIPPRVREGDTVAVVAPSGPVSEDRLRVGIARLRERFRVIVSRGLLSRTGYLAGTDERRADEVNRCLRDPDVRAVVCARGGYGSMRILEALDAGALRRDPKPIVGFSDVTAMLLWAAARAGVRAIHGPMAAQLGELGADDEGWLYRMLTRAEPAGVLPVRLSPIGPAGANTRTGPLWGGNLCMLGHAVGTGELPDLHGAVLFFEEVGERPYRIDRHLTHLSRAGVLRGVACALVGDLVRCEEPEPGEASGVSAAQAATGGDAGGDRPGPTALSVVGERLRHFGIPGLSGLPLAHGARNLALPLGARCAVDLATGRVTLLEAAVA